MVKKSPNWQWHQHEIIMAKKCLLERNGTRRNQCLLILSINCQIWKVFIGIRMPFVIGGVSEGSKYRFRTKDLFLHLMVKTIWSSKTILEKTTKENDFSNCLRDQKDRSSGYYWRRKIRSRTGTFKHSNLERLLQGEQTRIWFHGINSSRNHKGKDQLVGYGKQLKWFSVQVQEHTNK
jgi:hypothetical protein